MLVYLSKVSPDGFTDEHADGITLVQNHLKGIQISKP